MNCTSFYVEAAIAYGISAAILITFWRARPGGWLKLTTGCLSALLVILWLGGAYKSFTSTAQEKAQRCPCCVRRGDR